jgi:hypothetical protein
MGFAKENNAKFLVSGINELSNMLDMWLLIAEDYATGRVRLGDGSINTAFKEAVGKLSGWQDELKRMSCDLAARMNRL